MAIVHAWNWLDRSRLVPPPIGLRSIVFPYLNQTANSARLIWIIVGLYILGSASLLWMSGLGIAVGNGWRLLLVAPILAGLTWVYRRFRPNPWISCGSEVTLQIALILLAGTLATFATTALGAQFPYRDHGLAQADAWLGFDFRAYLAFVNARPWLGTTFHVAYVCMDPEFLLIVGALVIANNLARLQTFVIAMALALFLTIAIFIAMPAETYFAFLQLTPADYPNLNPTVAGGPLIYHLAALRSGSPYTVRLDDLDGLIAFPSFHTEAAILFIWGFWAVPWLRWWALAGNLLIIAATPIDGAHYVVDDIAGAALVVIALCIAKSLSGKAGSSGRLN